MNINNTTLILPNLMTSHSRQSVRWVGATELSYSSFKTHIQKGLTEPATGGGAPLVVSSEAARATKYCESGLWRSCLDET